jgi:hypothetical protein
MWAGLVQVLKAGLVQWQMSTQVQLLERTTGSHRVANSKVNLRYP